MFFIGEGSKGVSALDKSKATSSYGHPRNIGAVKVSKDLQEILTWDSDVEVESYFQLDEREKK